MLEFQACPGCLRAGFSHMRDSLNSNRVLFAEKKKGEAMNVEIWYSVCEQGNQRYE